MDIDALLARASDHISVRRVFGEPIDRDGALVIPAAVVAGGGGGGQGDEGPGNPGGSGGGFGVWARPVGVYVVRDGRVKFHPTIDVVPLALIAALVVRRLLRALIRGRS